MDKKTAAQLLGVTPRSVENYARDGKLSVTYLPTKNGKKADYNESEVLALKEELKTVVHRSIVTTNTPESGISETFEGSEVNRSMVTTNAPESGISEVFGDSDNQLQLLRLLAAMVITQSLAQKMVLTLNEAAQISGLTRSRLMTAAKTGELNAKIIGRGWKVRSLDLQEYVDRLFDEL